MKTYKLNGFSVNHSNGITHFDDNTHLNINLDLEGVFTKEECLEIITRELDKLRDSE